MSALGMSERFRFLGFRKDAARLVQAFDVIAVPSHVEPLGNATLEAMAAGRPVIGTRVGGIPEMIVDGKTGVLVPPSDPRALADAIARLVHDTPLRSAMADAATGRARRDVRLRRPWAASSELLRSDPVARRGRTRSAEKLSHEGTHSHLRRSTAFGSIAALRSPLIGLFIYVGFAVLRPQFIWGFAGDFGGISLIVGIATLIGWALNGFGSKKLGPRQVDRRRRWSCSRCGRWCRPRRPSTKTSLTRRSIPMMKFVMPFLIGVTLLDSGAAIARRCCG